MPCTFHWEHACVVKQFAGFVSAREFITSAETVAADPRFDDLRLIVNDLSGIDGHAIDVQAYLAVAASRIGAMRTNPNYRVAFVAREVDVGPLENVFGAGMQGLPFDPVIVPSLAAARAWMAEQPDLDNPSTRY